LIGISHGQRSPSGSALQFLYGIVTALAAERLAILSDAAGLQITSHLGAHL
jgi:hypothetical protein